MFDPYRLTYYIIRPLTQDVNNEFRKYYEKKASLGELVGVDGVLCSQDYFYKTWADAYPNLKLKADGDFMKCQVCSLHKGEIYGGGGQDQAQMEVRRAEYEKHLNVGDPRATIEILGRTSRLFLRVLLC